MRILFILFLFLSSLLLRAQSASEVYIMKYDSLAIEITNQYDIPASLVLGIALQESGAGTSKLCRSKHNHFGVKTRVRSTKTKSGYTIVYRKFDSDEASYLHFGAMLSGKKFYARLKGNMDYMNWLRAMKDSKYATSTKWIGYVDKCIKRYDLTRFDPEELTPLIPKIQIKDSIPVLLR